MELQEIGFRAGEILATAFAGWQARKLVQKRRAKVREAAGEIVEYDGEDDQERRGAVRRSEFNTLVRKIDRLVGKVDELVDKLTDHENRLDEADLDRVRVTDALRELTQGIAGLRGDLADLRGAK